MKGKRSKVWFEAGTPTAGGKSSVEKVRQMQREAKAQKLRIYLAQQNKRLLSGFVGQRHAHRPVEYKAWLTMDIKRVEKQIAMLT